MSGRLSLRRLLAVAPPCLLVVLALCLVPQAAHADGDPASDVLAEQSTFVPWDAGLSSQQTATLAALLHESRAAGLPLRVALIASEGDLGSVTELWRRPQRYAAFLGDELALVYKGPLLVVMPNGFGFHGFGARIAAVRAALSDIDVPRPGEGLGRVALTAVRRAAASSGHVLLARRFAASAGPRASTGSTGAAAWLAFGIGALLMAGAWCLSLRARPLRLVRDDAAG